MKRTIPWMSTCLLLTLPLLLVAQPEFEEMPQQRAEVPIRLYAELKGGGVALQWETAQGESLRGGQVQRRKAGSLWQVLQPLGMQSPSAHIDTRPESGTNHYRVKLMDVHGHEHASNVVSIHYAPATLIMYPNPTVNTLHLVHHSLQQGHGKVDILTLEGEKVQSHRLSLNAQKNEWDMNLADLPPGNYLLRFRTVTGSVVHLTFVKRA